VWVKNAISGRPLKGFFSRYDSCGMCNTCITGITIITGITSITFEYKMTV